MTNVLFPIPNKKPIMTVTNDMVRDLPFWESTFQQMNFPTMDLVEATAYPLSLLEKINKKKQYARVKRDFLRYISYHYLNDLRNAGLDEDDLFYLKKGIIPENFTVHVKIPFDYTGEVDFTNLVFMQTHPYHEDIHRFMDMQLEGMTLTQRPRKLYIPVPTGMVYIPMTSYQGSGGKNKTDRSVTAGFSEKAIEALTKKTMMGR